MKPIVILPPNEMDAKDIKLLIRNGLCVVVAKDPAKVKFLDPIPTASSRNQIEQAAIELSRKMLMGEVTGYNRSTFTSLWADILLRGNPLNTPPAPITLQVKK